MAAQRDADRRRDRCAGYTLNPTATTDSASQFDVVVTNGGGTATSAAATLTVNATTVAPTITTPPANVTVTAPNPATFSVVASGTAPLSYQWRRNGTPIGGATGTSYTLNPTAGTDNGAQFDVVVTNGGGTATSAAATLTVNATAVAPTITTPPANVTVTAPNPATFAVVASGTAPLSYQWRRNGTPIGGATSASYTRNPTAGADNGAQFDVVVTNGGGTATSAAATLTVNVAPTITTPPANITVTAPASATFSVVASGTAPLSYQWRRNGTPISGATGASYTLTPTAATDSGAQFDVAVTNVAGSTTSTAATLTVLSGGGGASAFSYFGSFSRYPTSDAGSSSSSKTVAIAPPAGMSAGQLAVVFAFYRDTSDHGQSVSVSGTGGQAWTAGTPFLSSTGHLYIRVFWTVFNGTWSASPSFALATSTSANAFTLYGVVFNAPAGANVNAAFTPVDLGTTALVSHPGVTTTVSGALVLGGVVQDSSETLSSWTSGWTNPNGETQWRNNRGDDSVFGLAYKVMGSAGATGSLSAVASDTNQSAAFMIAFGAP